MEQNYMRIDKTTLGRPLEHTTTVSYSIKVEGKTVNKSQTICTVSVSAPVIVVIFAAATASVASKIFSVLYSYLTDKKRKLKSKRRKRQRSFLGLLDSLLVWLSTKKIRNKEKKVEVTDGNSKNKIDKDGLKK